MLKLHSCTTCRGMMTDNVGVMVVVVVVMVVVSRVLLWCTTWLEDTIGDTGGSYQESREGMGENCSCVRRQVWKPVVR